MKKEMKMLVITLLVAISTSGNANENVNLNEEATCFMHKIESIHSSKDKRAVSSIHSVSITNQKSTPISYHIDYRNQFMSGSYWIDNNRKQYDVILQPGQSYPENFTLANELIFSRPQQFETQAITTITINGKILKQCFNKNVAVIY